MSKYISDNSASGVRCRLNNGVVCLFVYFSRHNQVSWLYYLILAMSISGISFSCRSAKPMRGLPEKQYLTATYNHNNRLMTAYPCSKTVSVSGWFGPHSYCKAIDSLKPMGPDINTITLGYEYLSPSKKRRQLKMGIEGQTELFYNAASNYSNIRVNIHPYIGFQNKNGSGLQIGFRIGNIFRPDFREADVGNNPGLIPTLRFKAGFGGVVFLKGSTYDSDFVGGSQSKSELGISSNLLKKLNHRLGEIGLYYTTIPTGKWYTSFLHGYNYGSQDKHIINIQDEFFISDKWLLKPSIGFMLGNKDVSTSKKINISLSAAYIIKNK